MFPPKKKKPGLDLTIAVGKPKAPPPDLSDPESLDEKPMPKPMPKMPKPQPAAAEEAAESPAEEGNEEYGAKLIADLEAAGEAHGLDAETTRAVAADFFRAMAECLRGGGSEETGEVAPDDETQEYGQ